MKFEISKLELNDDQLQKVAKLFCKKLKLETDIDTMYLITEKTFDYWNKKILEVNSDFINEEVEFKNIARVTTTFASEKLSQILNNKHSIELEKEELISFINHLFMLFESLKFGDLDFEERINLIQEG